MPDVNPPEDMESCQKLPPTNGNGSILWNNEHVGVHTYSTQGSRRHMEEAAFKVAYTPEAPISCGQSPNGQSPRDQSPNSNDSKVRLGDHFLVQRSDGTWRKLIDLLTLLSMV